MSAASASRDDDSAGAGRAIDTRDETERILSDALRDVTLKYDALEREKHGETHDLHATSYDMASHDALLANPERAAGALTAVDASGNVSEDYAKMEQFASEVLALALANVPDLAAGAAATPALAFQASFRTHQMQEQIRSRTKQAIIDKAKEEVRLLRRRFLMATELSKPKEAKPRGALVQAAFLQARDAAASRGGRDAANDANDLDASRVSLLTTADPYDESVFGVTNRAMHLTKQNARVAQTLLEYLLGYASVVDPTDLEEIEAAAQGLRVSRGKSLRELALKYAQHLDQTLPERHKRVLKTVVSNVAEEHERHVKMGAAAEERHERRPREGAKAVADANKNAWLRNMFPDAPWPSRSERADAEARAALRDTALGPAPGALINPMDPNSGVVPGGDDRLEDVVFAGGGETRGDLARDAGEGANHGEREVLVLPSAAPGAGAGGGGGFGFGFGGGAGDPGAVTAARGVGGGVRGGNPEGSAPGWLGGSAAAPAAGRVPWAGADVQAGAPVGLHDPRARERLQREAGGGGWGGGDERRFEGGRKTHVRFDPSRLSARERSAAPGDPPPDENSWNLFFLSLVGFLATPPRIAARRSSASLDGASEASRPRWRRRPRRGRRGG